MRLIVYALCLALVLSAVLITGGCNRGGKGSGAKRIGVTLLTREHEFYRQLEAGLKDAADKQGYELIITSGDFDLAKQQSQIENFVVQRVDAIIVCPADSKGIGPAIDRANEARIPVFTADIAAQGGQVVSHIASDNLSGGRLAADFIAKALNGQGNVGIIGQQELQTGLDREMGFKEEMKKYPGIKIVSVLNGGGVRDRALKAADDMLQGNSDLKAILRGSSLKADVAQQPRDLGAKTIEALVAHFSGGQVPKSIAVPVKVVDANALKEQGGAASQ